ncbi:bud emergence protein 1 [Apophysomyces ossiformis]|uniref:Bud emergence protein 1 n=1 Tax=Apophysomyces ossiformis TaxID=679940 RepID=A0A8H7BJ65_9FUNG|nr:bud emergence protein 1 [Apophysomyces ossiformis]
MLLPKGKVKPPHSLRSARHSVVKNNISTPVSATVPQHAAIAPPKKVIKALYDYKAQNPHELSFSRGDFFHVIGKEDDPHWFNACNPITNSQGWVPASYFQIIEKNERMDHRLQHGYDDSALEPTDKMQPLYGIVLYDFKAERSDELQAKQGEAIVVIAQSSAEWFVAKPIGRLGGPGLIPVSFVEIRNAQTGQTVDDIHSLGRNSPTISPPVEAWQPQTQAYNPSTMTTTANSNTSTITTNTVGERPLSAIFTGSNQQMDPIDEYLQTRIDETDHGMIHADTHIPGDKVISATIDSFIPEGDQFWFIVFARLSSGRHRVLYRLYEDFYEFQTNMLEEFPLEAGKLDRDRILPYMPGPLTEVNDEISADRQRDLNRYCQELLSLPRYLTECSLVQNELFGIHDGDFETEYDPRTGELRSQPTTIKVKIMHKDDIFAMKMPSNTTLEQLRLKIHDRVGVDVHLRYKDELNGDSLPLVDQVDMEEAFSAAVKVGKLIVYAE